MNSSGRSSRKRIEARLCGMSPVIILLVVMTIFTIANALTGVNYLTPSNVSVIINQACFLVIAGIGQALAILTGGINLSMGAVMAYTTVLWGDMLLKESGTGMGLPVLLVLLSGALIGLVNGLLITGLKIPPFIATFAVMYACRGLAWVYLRNRVIYGLNENFRNVFAGKLINIGGFVVTTPMVIAFVALASVYLLLCHTNYGRKVYFTGANPIAAEFSGINTDRVINIVYVISTALAALAGLMYVARLNSAEPGLGGSTHFEAITVALIGGFAMSGGYGNIWGVAGGAIVVYGIQNGMNSLQLPGELQALVNGLLIIFSVFLNRFLANRKMQLDNDLDEAATNRRHGNVQESTADSL